MNNVRDRERVFVIPQVSEGRSQPVFEMPDDDADLLRLGVTVALRGTIYVWTQT